MRVRRSIKRQTGFLCGLTLGFAVSCASDEPKQKDPPAAEEALVLDCTDVEGRSEDFPGEKELYYPDSIAEHLETYPFLRERYGNDEATTCEDARRFMDILEDENERIVEQYLAENPEVTPDEVVDISELDMSAELGPPDQEGGGGAGPLDPTQAAAGAAGTSGAVETGDATSDIEKVYHGSLWQFEPVMRILVLPYANAPSGERCTATAIAPKWMITAAHCVPSSGYYETYIYKQHGATAVLQFGGKIWMNYYRKPWSGWKDGGNDLAIATFWQNQTFSTSSDPVVDRRSYARIWLGSDPAGNWQYSLGYGKHYTSDADGSLHYGYNTITNETYVNYYWTKPTNSNNNDICPGDSGGPTGYWHDGLFAIHGINSASYCGKTSASTGQPLWGSLFHRAAYHSAWIGGLVGSCRYINLYSSQATVMQCFP